MALEISSSARAPARPRRPFLCASLSALLFLLSTGALYILSWFRFTLSQHIPNESKSSCAEDDLEILCQSGAFNCFCGCYQNLFGQKRRCSIERSTCCILWGRLTKAWAFGSYFSSSLRPFIKTHPKIRFHAALGPNLDCQGIFFIL